MCIGITVERATVEQLHDIDAAIKRARVRARRETTNTIKARRGGKAKAHKHPSDVIGTAETLRILGWHDWHRLYSRDAELQPTMVARGKSFARRYQRSTVEEYAARQRGQRVKHEHDLRQFVESTKEPL